MVLGANERHTPATRQLGLCLGGSANFVLARALAVSFVNSLICPWMWVINRSKQVPFPLAPAMPQHQQSLPLCWADTTQHVSATLG